MACHAAPATVSLVDDRKAGPCRMLITLDPEKISTMAWYSTHPRRGTPLIRYMGAVVIPMCTSSAWSLQIGTGASTP
jgi:hypothetical protein